METFKQDQFPYSWYPRCATLSWGKKELNRMKNHEGKAQKPSHLSAFMEVES
jgi:hypothetical protein